MQTPPLNDAQSISLPRIVLGSTSVFRKQLLEKLNLPFDQLAPDIDETPLKDETPKEMVARLSKLKAEVIAKQSPNSIVIGSDQTAEFNNQPIGKPHTFDRAVEQLSLFSGQTITFYTGLSVINTATQQTYEAMDITKVHFRKLSIESIQSYIEIEQPLKCAGSFKSEGLGITLFNEIESKDPNALIGLPLIELTTIFEKMGFTLPLKPATKV